MRALIVIIGALLFFSGAHYVMWLDGLNQWERAAYLAFQGFCKADGALCIRR